MMMMSMMIIMILLIMLMLMLMNNLIYMKTYMDREKNSSFECGFDPKNHPRLPFSLHFFLIATIFLIFDVEITLLMPMIMIMSYLNKFIWMLVNMIFLIILLYGLYHEWNQGALNWLN
uniref:NADH-ubiquinone oxidoreductase chain 3 n=1 Tax=Omoglymmius wukong TaxID=2983420 RepID=A0A977TLI7_9CARA|nr:NADH dehydrogenase subunit 3 [Omoglymmius wukong]UXW93692.1 NADH dehydrogenase subunit 3 [Omoglymmius wukong]